MVPDPEVATPLRLWASQEKVLVLFKPGRRNETKHVRREHLGVGGFKPGILAQHAELPLMLM